MPSWQGFKGHNLLSYLNMSYHGNFICTQIFSHSGVVLCWRLPGGKSAPGGAFPGWHKGCVLLHCQILSFWHFFFVPGLSVTSSFQVVIVMWAAFGQWRCLQESCRTWKACWVWKICWLWPGCMICGQLWKFVLFSKSLKSYRTPCIS